MKKCQKNGGKIVKKVILVKFAKPFVPHILSNKTYKYLLANNLSQLFKPTRYYITYDIETLEKKVNEKFGDSSQVIATLIPYAIASTVKLASGIHSFYYDIRTENFLDKMLEQLFEEAKQVKKDNKYLDETISQYYEVPVIGFNSAKFDASVLFKNLKSTDWTLSKNLGQNTVAKQIIVKHQSSSIHLRFVDFKIYSMQNKLKETVRDFGKGTNSKGRFPHEFINTNNYMNELNKCEPFPIEAFDNKLRNKKHSENKYKEYLVEAAKHKQRWDYLKYYNILDTRVLIEPIDYLIELMFKQKVDMLANISMSQCANAIKYSLAYNSFDINGDYNCESTDKSIEITQNYWRAKVEGQFEQDNKKNRDSSNNVTIDDYDYFKELFKNQRFHICNARFTWKNRPTLDRIDNKLGHQKLNVIPCSLYCNVYKANRDENQMKLMIQLRKYALFKQLPMTLTSDEGYKLLRKGITGGISNVMHRYNVAGKTKINHKSVYSIDSNYIQTHVVQLDFHSQYPSVMSGEPIMLNPYTNLIIHMPAQLIERITDQDRYQALIYDTNRFSEDPLVVEKMLLFVAEVRGHIDEDYINYCIDFGPILRNIDITTNKETIGEFMYNHLFDHQLPHDKTERKLTNLIDTNNEVMCFNNYYLWLLIDTCHLVIDEIVSVTTFTKHTNFNSFVKEFMNLRQQAKDAKNEGLGQFCKLILNSAFGGDALNSEKYSNTRLLSTNKIFLQHMMQGFINSTEINDDLYAVQVDKEHCRCNTCLQVAYFVLDSAKFQYVNFIYNFMNKAYNMSRMHFVQGDTDSLTWAISGSPNRGPDQLFEEVINYQGFYDRYNDCVFSEKGKKQILHIGVEKLGYNCIALLPKNYIINDEIVLKEVMLNQNPQINEQTFADCINKGTVTIATNTTLAQHKGTMSRLKMEKNAITGSTTKMIILPNQSCLPFISNISAD
ncbi:MAG: hypothetical protein EZS28_015721 [Streblomastix strix]|uniref:DNA-directed DNA polymerase n=1 Tax=Streblomastix strix TaxID=222440 RepID=A0A5J4W2Q9_9EUKA|nr:MAG: hypothetical protein EZS28_015721 [Streblomastix strix]